MNDTPGRAVNDTAGALRVGFVGTGLIAAFHSKMLRAAGDRVTRAGVFDIDAARAAAFAASSGHQVSTSIDEVIDGADAVYVTTWTAAHLEVVNRAVAAGRAVFVEKPLAPDLATAQALHDAVVASGALCQSGLVLRHSPAWAVAEQLVHDAAAGRLLSVVFRDDQYLPTQGQYASTWRGDVALAGAGTLLEHSVHDLDLLLRICGPVTDVIARTRFVHGITGIEDVAQCTFEFASGALASLTSVWHDNLARPSQRHVEFLCERRIVTVTGHDYFGPVSWQDSDGTTGSLSASDLLDEARALLPAGPNADVAFVDAVLRGEAPFPGVAEALAAQRLVDACYRSAASRH
jgi:UDP-N-acetyl-2-amino-2-deoxyglucuronate dehydrogenase